MSTPKGFDPKDVGVVVESEESLSLQVILSAVTLAVSLVISLVNIRGIFHYNSDKTISVVEAPLKFENDGVVLSKSRSGWSKSEKTRHIKAFLRTYIRAQFPQSPERIKEQSQIMANLSIDDAKDDAEGRLNQISTFKRLIEENQKMTFYPDSMLKAVYIKEAAYGWTVIVDGTLIKLNSGIEVRSKPSLEFNIEEVETTYDNPWGLAVSSFKFKNKGSTKE